MSIHDTVQASLANIFRVIPEGDAVRVTTNCLYPNNSFVQILVRGGLNTFVVSDEGAALQEIESAGIDIPRPDQMLRHLVMSHGLSMSSGIIRSPQISPEALGMAIAIVANVSRDTANWVFDHFKIKRERNFKQIVADFLRSRFDSGVREEILVGKSNKAHKFENLIHLPNGRRLIVDPVIQDMSSINARVVANLDVRAADYPDLEQRIVYDDEEDWKTENLNLLQVGATVIPFSQAPNVLGRLTGRV